RHRVCPLAAAADRVPRATRAAEALPGPRPVGSVGTVELALPMTDIRFAPATGRWAAIAPGRVQRPGGGDAPAEDREEACPFCAGHEDRTPPETLRLGKGPTGWDVRAVPNLYPALARQAVRIHVRVHGHPD